MTLNFDRPARSPPSGRLLPPGVPRLVVEAASRQGWQGVAGELGLIHGLRRFGGSAPGAVAQAELGFSPEAVAAAAGALVGGGARNGRQVVA